MADNTNIRLHLLAGPDEYTTTGVDFVTLHGLKDDWKQTWTSEQTRYLWLRDALAPKHITSRILCFDCSNIVPSIKARDVNSFIIALIQNRKAAGRETTPIVLIGHSLGGCLLKEIFTSTHPSASIDPEQVQLHRALKGYILFGTPQQPFRFDTLFLLMALGKIHAFGVSKQESLDETFKQVNTINADFRKLGGENLPILSFFETEQTKMPCPHQLDFVVPKNAASTVAANATNKPLQAKHSRLAQFDHDGGRDLMTVLQGISAILSHAGNVSEKTSIEPVADGDYSPPTGLRLLSLDGGGVRGLFTVCVLEKLMEAIPKREGSENRVQRPCDVFDIIAGTSTGGLLAIMLGRLQMDATSCKEKYISMSRTIFQPQGWSLPGKRWIDLAAGNPSFTGDALKEAICSVTDLRMSLEEKDELRALGKVPDQATLFSCHQARARTFVCAIREDVTECERLRTYLPINPRPEQHDLDPRSVLIWEAGRATSAAPTYFPSIQIANREYFDGGMQSNNPILEIVDEAHREHGRDVQIDAIVSIGTGHQSGGRPGPHIVDTIKHVLSRTTDAEAKHREFCSRLDYRALKEKYYRFQEFDRLGGIDLAAADKIEEIELIAAEYLDSYEGKRTIRDCAALLDSH